MADYGALFDQLHAGQGQAAKPDFGAMFDQLHAKHSAPAPEVPGEDPRDIPSHRPTGHFEQTHVEAAPMMAKLKLGLKARPEDRLQGAKELFPGAMVEQISDGSVVVRKPDGTVYNFEAPDAMHTLAGIGRRLVGMDSEIRDNPTIARNLDESASAALPEAVIRGVPSAIAAGLTGGAGLVPHMLTQAAAASASEMPRAAINAATAGGESRNGIEIQDDAAKEGLAAGLTTGALGYAGPRILSMAGARLGLKGAVSREIASEMGVTNKGSPDLKDTLTKTENLGKFAGKDLEPPLSLAERGGPDAGPKLREYVSDPKVANKAAFQERQAQDAVRDASEAVGDKETLRLVKESGKRVKPTAQKDESPLLGKKATTALRIGLAAKTFGASEAIQFAPKLARFIKGSPHRHLVNNPEVKAEVLRMLSEGLPDKEVNRYLAGLAGNSGTNLAQPDKKE
jgi:hypothetical protein